MDRRDFMIRSGLITGSLATELRLARIHRVAQR